MIPVSKIVEQVRIEEKDVSAVRFSDWDVINALNKALRLICNHYAMTNSDFLIKQIILPEDGIPEQGTPFPTQVPQKARAFDLPSDFITVDRVERGTDGYELHPAAGRIDGDSYHIEGNKLITLSPVILFYRCALPEVREGEAIDLPFSFYDFITSCTRLILGSSESSVVTQFIADQADKLIPARRYVNARIKMPWKV